MKYGRHTYHRRLHPSHFLLCWRERPQQPTDDGLSNDALPVLSLLVCPFHVRFFVRLLSTLSSLCALTNDRLLFVIILFDTIAWSCRRAWPPSFLLLLHRSRNKNYCSFRKEIIGPRIGVSLGSGSGEGTAGYGKREGSQFICGKFSEI